MIFQAGSRSIKPFNGFQKKYYTTNILFLFLFVFFSQIGCEHRTTKAEIQKGEVGDLTEAPSPEEMIDARIRYEIANLHAQAREKVSPTLSESYQKKDLSPAERVEQLIVEGHLLEAADETSLISDADERDSYLEDIVRQLIVHSVRLMQEDVSSTDIAEDTARKADKICQKISSPLIRSEVFGSIAVFCISQKLKKQADETTNKIVASLDEVKGNSLIKARKYFQAVRWFIGQDEQRALDCCIKAEKEAEKIDNAFDAATFYLESANWFLLLKTGERAKDAIEKAERQAEKIFDPKEQSTVFLKLASTRLSCPPKLWNETLKDRNTAIKELVRKTDRLIAVRYDEKTASTVSVSPTLTDKRMNLDTVHDLLTRSLVLPWPEIKAQRNEILAQIAKSQAWTDTLEDAWDTILEIEDGPQRDEAVAEVVDMLLTTEQPEEAEVWADEITDEFLKNGVVEKIEAAKKGADP